jgi:hypothetical protein
MLNYVRTSSANVVHPQYVVPHAEQWAHKLRQTVGFVHTTETLSADNKTQKAPYHHMRLKFTPAGYSCSTHL